MMPSLCQNVNSSNRLHICIGFLVQASKDMVYGDYIQAKGYSYTECDCTTGTISGFRVYSRSIINYKIIIKYLNYNLALFNNNNDNNNIIIIIQITVTVIKQYSKYN